MVRHGLRMVLSADDAELLPRLTASARVWEGERGECEETSAVRRLIGQRIDHRALRA